MSVQGAQRALTIHDIQAYRERGEKFAMLTAYDYLTAQILDEADTPILLVGDSLGMVMLGYESTLPVTMEDMVHHTRAVVRGARRALIVADMPFGSYQASVEDGVRNAVRLIAEGGAAAVKIEGGAAVVELTERLTAAGIPVMSHIGLTPQSVHQLGGYKVQGRSEEVAERIVADAVALAAAGAFCVLLEGVPSEVGRRVTEAVPVPTIGIGAGPDTDGQVLVIQDMLGLTSGRLPRFVKPYANLRATITDAVKAYAAEVADSAYPAPEHQY